MKIERTFNGTGAAVYLCLGFIPDKVSIRAVGDAGTVNPILSWTRKGDGFSVAQYEGVLDTNGATAHAPAAYGAGIEVYEGGEVLTAAMQTSVAFGEGVYLAPYDKDCRQPSADGGDSAGDTIDDFTMDTLANRTGHFNADVVGSLIGAGSEIVIASENDVRKYHAVITALTAGQGISANEVTISRKIASGVVRFIGPKYTMAPLAVGAVTLPGIKLNMTTNVNVNNELQAIEAELY